MPRESGVLKLGDVIQIRSDVNLSIDEVNDASEPCYVWTTVTVLSMAGGIAAYRDAQGRIRTFVADVQTWR